MLFSQASFSSLERKNKSNKQGELIQNGRFPSCHADVSAGSKRIGCPRTGHAPFTHGAAIKRLNHNKPGAVFTKATIGSIQELTKHPESKKKGVPVAAGRRLPSSLASLGIVQRTEGALLMQFHLRLTFGRSCLWANRNREERVTVRMNKRRQTNKK